jgi:hypothetical protein
LSCKHVGAGDKVSVLWGGRLPFLLREAKASDMANIPEVGVKHESTEMVTHELIGGYCYIHGLRDGQGLDIAEQEGITSEKICLV